MLTALAKSSDFIGPRDQRYTRQFNEITPILKPLPSSTSLAGGDLHSCKVPENSAAVSSAWPNREPDQSLSYRPILHPIESSWNKPRNSSLSIR